MVITLKRTIIFLIIIGFLTAGNIFFVLFSLQIYPAYGGFTRQILFIKPNQETNSGGYIIIIDDLAPESEKYEIDWLLHTRGDVNISSTGQSFISTVSSYISNDNISLNVTFLEPIESLTEVTGYFVPDYYREPYPYDDLETSEMKAQYSGSYNPLMAAVLYPKNDSDVSQSFPIITTDVSGLKKIGTTDYLYYNDKIIKRNFTSPSIFFDGQLFFLRMNESLPNLLEYFYLQEAQNLQFEGNEYFSSGTHLTNILASYSNATQISGTIKAAVGISTAISLYCPFAVSMVQLDGVNTTFSSTVGTVSFTISESCSFVISSTAGTDNPEHDPLRDTAPTRIKPDQTEWEFDINLIQSLTHPYIAFNKTDLDALRVKIQDPTKPWQGWYNSYMSGVSSYLTLNVSTVNMDSRPYIVTKLALKFAMDGGASYLDKIIEFLLEMNSITHYPMDLDRAYAVQAYALAYDIIYNNLSASENTTIYQYLYDHTEPLMKMDLYSANNHRVVDAGALGVAGLALKNVDMINIAIDTILIYFYTQDPADGGSYEGYSYNAFAMDEMIQFASSLKSLNGFNFFNDSKFVACLDFMAETLGPIGLPNLYEDCALSSRLQEVLLIAAAQINNTSPIRAQNYQYIWEQVQSNAPYPGAIPYPYIQGRGPTFRRITCYNLNDTITAAPYASRKEIWRESSMAFLRSADTPNSLFLSFSCKNYFQSHTHYDENSFELWAFGAYIVNNPGYPGFGYTYHDWMIGTEGSNTLLIGGSGQQQYAAEGLSASISSPYFSMVIGQANNIYDDFGSFEYSPEYYILLIVNFFLIGIACVLFYQISQPLQQESKTDLAMNSGEEILTKSALLKMAFLHPNQTQDYIYKNKSYETEGKFLNRIISLFIAGLMTIIFVLLILDMKSIIDYHSVYYQDEYIWLMEILIPVELAIIGIGTLLTFFGGILIIKLYGRFNRFLVHQTLREQHLDLTKAQLNSVSRMSLIWQFPVLIFSALLLYFTSVSTFKLGIHEIFIGLGSPIAIYEELLSLLAELIRNFAIIFIIEVPFLLITLGIFSYGTNQVSDGYISKKTARKIPLISIILISLIILLLFCLIYIGFKWVMSMITIEWSVQG